MNSLQSSIIANAINYSISGISASSVVGLSNQATNTGVFIDNNSIINELQQLICFKNEEITNKLIGNKELLSFLSEAINMIAANGVIFHADLELITNDPNETPQLLLVYYPRSIFKTTAITSQKELSANYSSILYRQLVKHLFKFSIAVRKSVVVDEQRL